MIVRRLALLVFICLPYTALCQLDFAPPITTEGNTFSYSIAVGDFNGNGADDFVVFAASNVTVFYSQNTSMPLGSNYYWVTI